MAGHHLCAEGPSVASCLLRFRQFDFGDDTKNLEQYGTMVPPEYSLAYVRTPPLPPPRPPR